MPLGFGAVSEFPVSDNKTGPVSPSGTIAQTLFRLTQSLTAFTGNVVTQRLFAPKQSVSGTVTVAPIATVAMTLFKPTQLVKGGFDTYGTVAMTLFKPKELVAATFLTVSTSFSSYWTQAP